MDNRIMPDTPWHVGYTKKEENDPRRHKSRCIYNDKNKCTTTKSPYYMRQCGGSAHCIAYAEEYTPFKKSYYASEQSLWIDIASLLNRKLPRYFWDYYLFAIVNCPICGNQIELMDDDPYYRYCNYCKSLYVSRGIWKKYFRDPNGYTPCFLSNVKITDKTKIISQLQEQPLRRKNVNWNRLNSIPDFKTDTNAYKSFRLI